MLILIAKLRAEPGCIQDLVDMAEGAIGPSRSEGRCIKYEFRKLPFDRDSFTFFDKWGSREDILLHFEEPHFPDFALKSRELIEGTASLVKYEVTGENRIQ